MVGEAFISSVFTGMWINAKCNNEIGRGVCSWKIFDSTWLAHAICDSCVMFYTIYGPFHMARANQSIRSSEPRSEQTEDRKSDLIHQQTLRSEFQSFLHDLIEYQKKLVVHYKDSKETKVELKYNIHEYFNDLRAGKISQLKSGKFTYSFVTRKDYSNSKKLFSREILWYGRKGGKFFHPVKNLSSSASLSN